MTNAELARIAYEAYWEAMGFESIAFERLEKRTREAFESAAQTVVHAVVNEMMERSGPALDELEDAMLRLDRSRSDLDLPQTGTD